MTFKLSVKQDKQLDLMGSAATHVMAYGGSRSGKTFGFVRGTMIRAMAHRSRHAMLRYRFNHIKASIILDTLPKVMDLCFPGTATHCHLDKTDWFYAVPTSDSTPNSGAGRWSEIWFGGLDDKERTEKILGQEYATMYLNECSQIPYASRNMAMTRLAQNTPLRLKAYYDCNPPGMAHWTYRLFIEKRDPDRKSALANPNNFAALVMNPADNMDNLPATYLEELQNMGEAMRRRFLLGQFADVSDSALWTLELLDQQRIVDGKVPEMVRIVVAVDPSGVAGEEDKRSDEVGIVVCGLGKDGRGYILEDLSGRMAPAQWGQAVVSAYERHDADCVVAEENFGGAMVAEIVRSAAALKGITVPYRAVKASRGKVVRAEPVSVLFEQQKVSLVGLFPDLEDQLCAMTTAGYVGSRSPDRADAMIWGLAHLFPSLTRRDDGPNGRSLPQVTLGYAKHKGGRR
ncbi:phage terminase, large subunit, PBSX family [Aminobacter sp. MSH1]|uniref:phage terminase large subunit n=1 Tax=Aminobacter sp. MSH1 TaxID=374606 RepID=UPI000D504D4A|nr:phage terminase large subunit [Aminobacter sp. MSH1]AWC25606.1 phage terminase, large subunit, PBSX family [Aminobacter sp. MSH1]